MARWLAVGSIINIILNKGNLQWSTCILSRENRRSSTHHSPSSSLFFLSSHSLSLFLSIRSVSFARTHSHAHFRVAHTYSINRKSRYCTASSHLLSTLAPHISLSFSLSLSLSLHTIPDSYLRFAAVVTLFGGGARARQPPRRASPPVDFCPRSNKYQQRDSYTGSNPSLSYTLINSTALRSRGIHADDLTTGVIGKHSLPLAPSLTFHPHDPPLACPSVRPTDPRGSSLPRDLPHLTS